MLVSDQIGVLRAMGIGGTEHELTTLLRKSRYNLEAAIALYFQEAASSTSSGGAAKGSIKTESLSSSAVVINIDDNEEVEHRGHSRSATSSGNNSSNINNKNNNSSSSSSSKVSVTSFPLIHRKRKVEEDEEVIYLPTPVHGRYLLSTQ